VSTPPAGRYGPEPTARTRLWRRLGLAALILVALAVLVWLGVGTLRDPVQWRDVGYHVNGSTSIDVTFDVTKATGATATCRVEALSDNYAQVGVQDVEVGPGAQATQRVTVTLPTSQVAVTGTVRTCRLAG
jgi:hypothetical protein